MRSVQFEFCCDAYIRDNKSTLQEKMKHKYNFSPTITSNVEFLNHLAKTKSDKRKHTLLVSATPEQILAIVEVSANILKNNFVLTNRRKGD